MEKLSLAQPKLKKNSFFAYLILNNMFLTMSLDMYLPALPSMSVQFGVPAGLVNLTLTAFIFAYAASSFFWGPLSDKYGRKPCLLAAAAAYVASSLLCALTDNIYHLIAFRVIQGFAAGAMPSISVAIVKDCFSGAARERMLAFIVTMSSVSMVFAPLIGAQLLRFSDYRASFVILAALGVLSFLMTLLYRETQPAEERSEGSIASALKVFSRLFKNKSYFYLVLIFSASNLPYMGYVAVSSYVYIDFFGMSEQMYSVFFSISSVLYLLGPSIYIKLFSRKPKRQVGTGFFLLSIVSGALVFLFGRISPIAFLLSFSSFAILYSGIYPFYTSLVFDQHAGDTGSASSMLTAIVTIVGSVGTAVASLFGSQSIRGLGLLIVVFSVLPLAGWLGFLKSKLPCHGVKQEPTAAEKDPHGAEVHIRE